MISFGAQKWQGEVLSTEVKNSVCHLGSQEELGAVSRGNTHPQGCLIHRNEEQRPKLVKTGEGDSGFASKSHRQMDTFKSIRT